MNLKTRFEEVCKNCKKVKLISKLSSMLPKPYGELLKASFLCGWTFITPYKSELEIWICFGSGHFFIVSNVRGKEELWNLDKEDPWS